MDDLRRGTSYDLAATAALLAEPARVAMIFSLMDGEARPATELAQVAGVSPSTASAHLASLVRGGLVQVERLGRHRYHRLAGERAARAIEGLTLLTPPSRPAPTDSPERVALRGARTCYRHLAGTLGVGLVDALLSRHLLGRRAGTFSLTPAGRRVTVELELLEPDAAELTGTPCLDWTERRDHVSGPLGVALTKGLLERGWLRHRPGTRALRVTVDGSRGFRDAFGMTVGIG
jgi:DNA-binding transcriptional ArsR family regulator